jgi:hypothetical protein
VNLLRSVLPPDHEIAWIACPHEGNGHQHTDGIEEAIDWVAASPNRYAALLGDLVEAITITDPRYEHKIHQKRASIIDQYNGITDRFRRIRKRILFALSGNHDHSVRHYGDGIASIFCKNLKVPYGTFSCKLRLVDRRGKQMYKVFATHGAGHISSVHPDPVMREASLMSQVKRKLAKELHADCHVQVTAHYHQPIVVPPYQGLYLVDDGFRMRQQYVAEADPRAKYIPVDLRWHCAVPGWVKKYSSLLGSSGYVERRGLQPVPLGFLVSIAQGGKTVAIEKHLV